jgi:hypothetical protein
MIEKGLRRKRRRNLSKMPKTHTWILESQNSTLGGIIIKVERHERKQKSVKKKDDGLMML